MQFDFKFCQLLFHIPYSHREIAIVSCYEVFDRVSRAFAISTLCFAFGKVL